MRTVLTFVLTASVAFATEVPLLHFSGSVVDGLDQPIGNAAVRVYNGHMGIDTFQIDSEAVVHTETNGGFSGVVTGEVFTTYRTVSKEPYQSVEEFGNWNTNGVVRLLQKKEFTTNEVEDLMATQGTALYNNIVDILAKDWTLGRGVWLFVKSPVRKNCTPGSARGAPGNGRPYRDAGEMDGMDNRDTVRSDWQGRPT